MATKVQKIMTQPIVRRRRSAQNTHNILALPRACQRPLFALRVAS